MCLNRKITVVYPGKVFPVPGFSAAISNCTLPYYFAIVLQYSCNDILFCAFVVKKHQLFKFSELWHKLPISCPTKMQNTVVVIYIKCIFIVL